MTVLSSYSEVLRICGCAVLAAVCLLILRGLDRSGISGGISICIGAVFALTAVCAVKPLIGELRSLSQAYLGQTYAEILWRATAVGITVQLTADAIRDAGEGRLAERVEGVGRAALLCIGLPLYRELFSLAGQLFGM